MRRLLPPAHLRKGLGGIVKVDVSDRAEAQTAWVTIKTKQRLQRFFYCTTMQDFFENVARYPRYLIALVLGVFWNAIEPLIPFLRRPTTAIALISALISALIFLSLTIQAMLGLSVKAV